MSGKRAFLDLLKQEGVEIVFGNPGTTELQLMDAFATESDIRYVLGLQEAAIMAMADGYAQASGKLAVVNLHITPGLGNAMGAIINAAAGHRSRRSRLSLSENHAEHIENWRAHLKHERARCNRSFASLVLWRLILAQSAIYHKDQAAKLPENWWR